MSDWRASPALEIFTDRVHELSMLDQAAADLEQGRPHHIALFGLRRIGKTLLCQEQMRRLAEHGRVIPAYMNLEGICTSPELFVQRYIGLTCFWAVTGGEGAVEPYLSAVDLLQTPAAAIPVVLETVRFLLTGLERTEIDSGALLHQAFDFPDRLAAAIGRPIMCFLDEFTELTALARFPQVGNPYKLFRTVMQQHAHVGYVVTGSAVTAMEQMVRSHESPLFLQLRAIELPPLTAEDTQALTTKIIGRPLNPAAQAEVYTYTAGHPFYVTALVERLRELAPGDADAISADQVAQAFLLETLGIRGQIYNYCRYLYDISLQKARGYAVLKALLQILAEEEGLSLTEAARRLHRRPSSVQDYLRWLMEVDLLVAKEQRYFFRDPVLRYWVAYTSKGIESDGFPRTEDLKGLVADLSERFTRVSTQLGRAKETIPGVVAQTGRPDLPGIHLGQVGAIHVPVFTRIEPYRSADGQTEIDALAENGKRWAVEVKWRQKRVGHRELDQLLAAAINLQARPWCIAQAGFTPEALAFAAENGVLVSSGEDVAALAKLIASCTLSSRRWRNAVECQGVARPRVCLLHLAVPFQFQRSLRPQKRPHVHQAVQLPLVFSVPLVFERIGLVHSRIVLWILLPVREGHLATLQKAILLLGRRRHVVHRVTPLRTLLLPPAVELREFIPFVAMQLIVLPVDDLFRSFLLDEIGQYLKRGMQEERIPVVPLPFVERMKLEVFHVGKYF